MNMVKVIRKHKLDQSSAALVYRFGAGESSRSTAHAQADIASPSRLAVPARPYVL
jgi:hypothetical protein